MNVLLLDLKCIVYKQMMININLELKELNQDILKNILIMNYIKNVYYLNKNIINKYNLHLI